MPSEGKVVRQPCLYPPHSPRRQVLEKLSSNLTPLCALECGKAPLMFVCLSTVIRSHFSIDRRSMLLKTLLLYFGFL